MARINFAEMSFDEEGREICIVLTRGRETEQAIVGVINRANELLKTDFNYLMIDKSKEIEKSFLHRDTENCEENCWEWEIDDEISEEPVWLIYVKEKVEEEIKKQIEWND